MIGGATRGNPLPVKTQCLYNFWNMPLKECYECELLIEESSKTCPHCGGNPDKTKNYFQLAVIWFLVAAFVSGMFMAVY